MKVGIRESLRCLGGGLLTLALGEGGVTGDQDRVPLAGKSDLPKYRRVAYLLEVDVDCLKVPYFELAPSNNKNNRRNRSKQLVF